MPLQHANRDILRAMKRPANAENALKRIEQWREICPDITLRSTFIVGFPGETEAQFEELLDFIRAAQLDRVGCFTYSPVEGAKANELPDHVPEDIQLERYERFMEVQSEISEERLYRKLDTRMTVLVDEIDQEGALARSAADAPEIDGLVFVDPHPSLEVGEFVDVEITHTSEHDLWGRVVD
jgi:ribosomal protein S12 methylthiotransferase